MNVRTRKSTVLHFALPLSLVLLHTHSLHEQRHFLQQPSGDDSQLTTNASQVPGTRARSIILISWYCTRCQQGSRRGAYDTTSPAAAPFAHITNCSGHPSRATHPGSPPIPTAVGSD
ncbi:hypothetical protein EV127DRAFT_108099 [Xylaria flabelliformis]|nr:hypothetical protein EV127DRAFT_108099 [Xylaria flabelliformis]